MGKYSITHLSGDVNSTDAQLVIGLNTIANELAEANRLKRLELCFLQVTSGLKQETIDDIFDHDRELEDQA